MTSFYQSDNFTIPEFRHFGGTVLLIIILFFSSCTDNSNDLPNVGDELSFELEDLNNSSVTYGELIGPHSFKPKVTLYYFTNKET